MSPAEPTTAELLAFYKLPSSDSDLTCCWTLYLREQERRLDNLCMGLIALASPPSWPRGCSARD